jgi:hypothetical protein
VELNVVDFVLVVQLAFVHNVILPTRVRSELVQVLWVVVSTPLPLAMTTMHVLLTYAIQTLQVDVIFQTLQTLVLFQAIV